MSGAESERYETRLTQYMALRQGETHTESKDRQQWLTINPAFLTGAVAVLNS